MCKHHLNSAINWIQNQQVDRIIPVRSNLSLSPCTGREFRAKLIKPVWVNVHGDLSDKIFPDMDPSPVVCLRVQENIWMKKKKCQIKWEFTWPAVCKYYKNKVLSSQNSCITTKLRDFLYVVLNHPNQYCRERPRMVLLKRKIQNLYTIITRICYRVRTLHCFWP